MDILIVFVGCQIRSIMNYLFELEIFDRWPPPIGVLPNLLTYHPVITPLDNTLMEGKPSVLFIKSR